jgi:ABC-2 type transport system ATP-binding protein
MVVENVTKRFGETLALNDVSLEVPAGCVFGLIGPNGSGKTTLIRVALDLLRATTGSIKILGRDSRRHGVEVRHQTSYLPGNLVLPRKLTGRQYLADIAELRGVRESTDSTDLADRLDADLDRPIGHLSLGNRRKIGLISALSHRPQLLFLDEPTAGMDPLVQQTFRRLVRESADRGATVFLSSHVLDEVQHVSDRIAVVQQGRVVATGTVDELTSRLTRTFEVTFAQPIDPSMFHSVPSLVDVCVDTHPHALIFRVRGTAGPLFERLAEFHPSDIRGTEPDLEDAFLDLYRATG